MLDHIFKYAPSGFVTVWAKNQTGSITRWFDLSEADTLHQAQQAAIDLDARGYDVYFSTCPARSSGENGAGKARIKAADVASVPAFFMDIDTLLDGSKLGKRLPAGVTEAVAALEALTCPPTVCVSSGHGVHAYWVLREPMAITSPQDLESAKKLLRSFADAVVTATGFLDCDAHASEPSRVLRVAGTSNHKMGQLLPVEVIERAQSPEYDLKDLQAFVSAQEKRPSEKADNAKDNERSASHLDGEQLLGKARRADPLLDALYCGDWKVRYPSQSEADLALCSKLAFWFQKDAVRIDEIFRQSSLFRVKWDEKHHGDGSTYGQKTVEMAISGCRDVYVPKAGHYQGTRSVPYVSDAMVQALMSLHPEKNDRYAWNDIGNGNLFADLYKLRARYVPERSKWAVFDGRIWQFDLGGLAVMQLCKELSDSLMAYALTLTDEKTRQEYMRFLSRWQRRSFRETILKDAASVYPLPFVAFDRDPMLFNCLNGTLNLDNGRFSPHRPEDYLSKLSGVTFDPASRCERWERFIDEVMQGDAGKARFLQKALGYALTGDARHECFFILYGPSSRNGKGTTMETYARLMGDYGKSAKPDTIAQRQTANGSGPSEDIARLIGARFVNVSEPDKKMVLSAALVKTLTGRDTVTARFLHENSIEFRPEFKLFINSNYLPQVTDVTLFSSGRVMVIPFERHFREDEQDRDLKDVLAQPESLSGILNWALAGLRGVIDEGLNPPGAIRLATDEYRERSDKIGRFVAEVLEEHPLGEARTTEVFARYQTWCFANGIHSESSPNFNAQLKSYGRIEKRRPAGSARTASPVSMLLGFRLSNQLPRGFSNTEEAGYGH